MVASFVLGASEKAILSGIIDDSSSHYCMVVALPWPELEWSIMFCKVSKRTSKLNGGIIDILRELFVLIRKRIAFTSGAGSERKTGLFSRVLTTLVRLT